MIVKEFGDKSRCGILFEPYESIENSMHKREMGYALDLF